MLNESPKMAPNAFEIAPQPEVPAGLGNKLFEGIGKGIDWLINDVIIGGLGEFMDKATVAVAGMGAGLMAGGGSSYSAGRGEDPYEAGHVAAAPTPGQSRGQDIEAPAMGKALTQATEVAPPSVSPESRLELDQIRSQATTLAYHDVSHEQLGALPPQENLPSRAPSRGESLAIA